MTRRWTKSMRTGLMLALFSAFLYISSPSFAGTGAVADRLTPTREADQETLGAGGLQKCAAYKRVQRHSDELQRSDHGHLTPGDTRRLSAELKRARALAPVKLSPAECGVPL